jgi:hypothetical protein
VTLRVHLASDASGYGLRADLETFYRLNNPSATPSASLTFTDHLGASFSVNPIGKQMPEDNLSLTRTARTAPSSWPSRWKRRADALTHRHPINYEVYGCFCSPEGCHYFCRIQGYTSTQRKQSYAMLDGLTSGFSGQPSMPRL